VHELEVALERRPDATVLEVLEADAATIDLAEATRIVAGGAGLGDASAFALLESVGAAMGAAMGATRVVADRGDVAFKRQIGTTGVAVNPSLYVAFGISGAVQHTSGLGHPQHVVSVNLDRSCPMMAMADLAIVADARATLEALARRLEVDRG
jgi:electron transfer flavoprotein alpha subunit